MTKHLLIPKRTSIALGFLVALPSAARAEAVPDLTPPETVTVIGTSPLPGTAIDINKLPNETQTLVSGTLEREGTPSVITALNDELGSVNINDNLDDPFQPDILFRGFEASPVLGTPEGLAVYQNGVRANEGFGDTLNWDLIPDQAVDRIDVVSANPVYGLNALGGAVIITMKDGFNFRGVQADVSGGAWGQRQGGLQFGANDGTFGIYISVRGLKEDGWREFSPDTLEQLYTDLSYRSGPLKLDLSFTADDNQLAGESPSPVQELAVSRSLVFTTPQSNDNRLQFVTLSAHYDWGNGMTLQGDVYYRIFHQSVINGNTTNYVPCASASGFLCQGDGMTAIVDQAGAPIPDISQGGAVPIGENDFETTRTAAAGGTIQVNDAARLFGHGNQLTLGTSIDRDIIAFGSSAEIGAINSQLVVGQSGYFVATPEGTPFTATPVSLDATNTYYGIYVTDTFDATDALSITASSRYNLAPVDLRDQLGYALTGNNKYSRLDPAIGFSYRITSTFSAFAGYSEGNRAPTPAEIECSSPTAPCLLPSSLSSDPPNLRQVVSHTYEAGLRGQFDALGGRLIWNANLFRTDVDDDIYPVATSLSSGYFQNIGGTQRQGADLGLKYRGYGFSTSLDYSHVGATFQSSFLLPSPLNSADDGNGDILVKAGDALPGIPTDRVKLDADYRVTPQWIIGGSLVYESSQYFRGDESNQIQPLPEFAILNLHTSYQILDTLTWWLNVTNVTNAKYATFGALGDPTGVGAPGVSGDAGADNRFESPAAPLSIFSGFRLRV